MIEITDDLLDAAVAAYVDAIDLDVTNKHLMTKVLEAVIPLIAFTEREACAQIASAMPSDAGAELAGALEGPAYVHGLEDTAEAIASAIRARGASCA